MLTDEFTSGSVPPSIRNKAISADKAAYHTRRLTQGKACFKLTVFKYAVPRRYRVGLIIVLTTEEVKTAFVKCGPISRLPDIWRKARGGQIVGLEQKLQQDSPINL